MNLRKLELVGFKTFARRTEMPLSGGVTAIVGPNGSGKSNLADALRWVLGEQSLQHIRSKRTEDVIFAGSSGRPAMGMGEVVLTLDNTSGWIPLDFSEVTLTRRAHRSGDNEYFINGSRVRLRDIVDLRSRAGFGQSSYSVIGQGLVDQVLSQRPDERRALFEEAAGVRHYQAKRDQAVEQLAATRQNLLRAGDIIAEITPRLNSLRHQSERARQYEAWREELRILQVRWYASRHRVLESQLDASEGQLAAAQKGLEVAAGQVQANEARAGALEAERQDLERSSNDELQRVNELRRQRQQAQGQLELAGDKLSFMEQQGQDVERELREMAEQQVALSQERAELTGELERLRTAEAELQQRLVEAEEEASARLAAQRQLERQLRQAREELIEANAALSQRQQEMGGIERRMDDLERQAQQHEADIRRKSGLVAGLTERIGKLRGEVRAIRDEEEASSEAAQAAREELRAAETKQSELQQALDGLLRKRHELATRLQLMAELQASMEGLGDAAKVLLKQPMDGIVGPLAAHLSVEPGYERAIGTALGFKLQAVLVEDDEALLRALELLPESGGTLAAGPWTASGVRGPGPGARSPKFGVRGIVAAVEVVRSSHPAVGRLLADVGIAADLASALAERSSWRRIATLEGDVVDSDGTVTRRGASAEEAVLKRQRALGELSAELEALDGAIKAEKGQLDDLRGGLEERRLKLAEAEDRAKESGQARQQRLNEMRDLAQQQQAAQAQMEWMRSLREQISGELQSLELRQAALRAQLDQSQARIPELQRSVGAHEAELAGLEQTAQEELQPPGRLRVEIGVTQQRLRHLDDRLRGSDQDLAHAERQLAARRKRADERSGTLQQLQAELRRWQQELERTAAQLAGREAMVPPLRSRLSALQQELDRIRAADADARERHVEQDKACYRLSFEAQRKRDEMEGLSASLLDELQLTVDLLPMADPDVPEPSKREVDALKARIATLGPINADALTEYEEVRQPHAFLTSQAADLEQAAGQLERVIAELEGLTERQFRETFEAIKVEFQRHFETMFGGGRVQLLLTEPEALNSSGIEILAQPPGKRLQSLPALSGGERALVAASLLFAILTVKPVPFCLLDEVDAALDEANVARFCQSLKILAQNTQFVVITHNRETMAMADALYGVSMNQDGVSKLFSMRLARDGSAPANEAVLAAG
ncbi:MAG: chromosome segregation protein SMC [Chloroflexota bacterium]|nr:chromosome segregation protein SMC [Chloroflexota bacterium]